MSDKDNIQPAWKPGNQTGIPKFQAGGPKSITRLNELQYDPIGKLVGIYHKLEDELKRQEQIRDGEVVELNARGNPRAYNAETHHAVYDRLINIGEKLLRYGYGRVPELITIEERKPQPLIVNLTKKGEVYIANDSQPDESL